MNASEKRTADWYAERGWIVNRCGWPDFLMYRKESRELVAVEVKTDGQKLTKEQFWMRKLLTMSGLRYRTAVVDAENVLRQWEEGKRLDDITDIPRKVA